MTGFLPFCGFPAFAAPGFQFPKGGSWLSGASAEDNDMDGERGKRISGVDGTSPCEADGKSSGGADGESPGEGDGKSSGEDGKSSGEGAEVQVGRTEELRRGGR